MTTVERLDRLERAVGQLAEGLYGLNAHQAPPELRVLLGEWQAVAATTRPNRPPVEESPGRFLPVTNRRMDVALAEVRDGR
jgi:hypothetical protein